MTTEKKTGRRQEILRTIAFQLENNPGAPIRTAALAKAIGVSEAALYRHFPSKAKMFEALIEFAEDTIFSRITFIQKEHKQAIVRCKGVIHLMLTFTARNPGITSILMGNAIMGENEKLRIRVAKFFDRLETQ
ncbi:MAG TPA: nucleoid occlusion factor SlmA, partial [Gammaproteobacteria bacterium]|nr:nucleoid occlusion factor SlmA [Gammaproteobacteria bacterium]